MRKLIFSAAPIICIFLCAAIAADISGAWTVKMKGPQGGEGIDMAIKAAGESLTITANHPMLQEMIDSSLVFPGKGRITRVGEETSRNSRRVN